MAQLNEPAFEVVPMCEHPLGWLMFVPLKPDLQHHVIPNNDIRFHDPSLDCICHPEDNHADDDYVYVHKAFDGRGEYQTGKRQLN